ncbi:unnamed protein product, partial [Ilex paraguariensis]
MNRVVEVYCVHPDGAKRREEPCSAKNESASGNHYKGKGVCTNDAENGKGNARGKGVAQGTVEVSTEGGLIGDMGRGNARGRGVGPRTFGWVAESSVTGRGSSQCNVTQGSTTQGSRSSVSHPAVTFFSSSYNRRISAGVSLTATLDGVSCEERKNQHGDFKRLPQQRSPIPFFFFLPERCHLQ